TVRRNHCGRNIGHHRARAGILAGNPIHEEMEAAADLAGLAFVLNVVVAEGGALVAAVAGGWRTAHAAGVELVKARVGAAAVPSAVTLTSHGGYPLDQNLYQAIKGMVTAEATTLPGGFIVLASACADGVGGEAFARTMEEMTDPADFYRRAERTPPDETIPDQWTSQILARILANYRVLLVAEGLPPGTILPPGLYLRGSLQEALDEALAEAGPDAKVTVVPDGARTLVLPPE
ncbi:MAG: lactate racemization operon protein LarA, partial [Bacteroidota bacterium]